VRNKDSYVLGNHMPHYIINEVGFNAVDGFSYPAAKAVVVVIGDGADISLLILFI
jgi:hypothetical protein